MKNRELFFIKYEKKYIINISNYLFNKDCNDKKINDNDITDNLKNEYIIKAQNYIIKKEKKYLLKLNILDFVTGKFDFLCKSSFIKNLYGNKHICLFRILDKKYFKFIEKCKKEYLIQPQTLKNLNDNYEFMKNNRDNVLVGKNSELSKMFNRRFVNLKQRCIENNYPIPNESKILKIFNETIETEIGFKCFYCKQELRFKGENKLKSIIDNKDLFTFEHRKPLSKGGTHEKDNIVFSCMSCNTLKEDMPEEMFIEFLNKISSNFKNKLFEFKMNKILFINSKFKYYKNEIKENEKEIKILKIKLRKNIIYSSQLLDKIK